MQSCIENIEKYLSKRGMFLKIPKDRKLEILIFEEKYSLKEHREQTKF